MASGDRPILPALGALSPTGSLRLRPSSRQCSTAARPDIATARTTAAQTPCASRIAADGALEGALWTATSTVARAVSRRCAPPVRSAAGWMPIVASGPTEASRLGAFLVRGKDAVDAFHVAHRDLHRVE